MKLIYKSSHWDEEQQRILVFLTNHRSFAASTIAVYRQRWQIELFFKALKQKPAHQELRRHQPQRPANSDLDGADRPARAQVPATAGSLRLEPIQSGRSVAPAPVRLSSCGHGSTSPSSRRRCWMSSPSRSLFFVKQLGQQNRNLNPAVAAEGLKMPHFSAFPEPDSG